MLWARSSLSGMRSSLAWLSVSPSLNLLVMDQTSVWRKLTGMRSLKKKNGLEGLLRTRMSCYFNNETYSFTFDAGAGTPLMITFANSTFLI